MWPPAEGGLAKYDCYALEHSISKYHVVSTVSSCHLPAVHTLQVRQQQMQAPQHDMDTLQHALCLQCLKTHGADNYASMHGG